MKKISIVLLLILFSINISASDKNGFREKQIKFIKELYLSGRYFDSIAETGKLQVATCPKKHTRVVLLLPKIRPGYARLASDS